MLLEVGFGKEYVLLYIVQHLTSPLFALAEGCYRGNRGKYVGLVELVGLHPSVEPMAKLGVGHDSVRAYYASHVECLGGGLKRDAYVFGLLADSGQGDVLVSELGKVGMYLVAYHYHFMLVADLCHAFKCVLAPLYASGIVRVAQNHHLAALQRLLQTVEIHLIE